MRQLTSLDRFLTQLDQSRRTLVPKTMSSYRSSPAAHLPKQESTHQQNKHTAGLIRVNHTGEVCAQALYQGQASTAQLKGQKDAMMQAAKEEEDHLVWCEERLLELQAAPSKLNPLWYALSFLIGASAGKAGDQWSLGFVAETEYQVCRHLDYHLEQIPLEDQRSRAILEQMKTDEMAHATQATLAGGRSLPTPIKLVMSAISKVMTTVAYRL